MQLNSQKPVKKIYPAQVHIIHSMIHMVKHKLKHEPWMNEQEVVEANVMLFEKMGIAIRKTYSLDYVVTYSWNAARLYIETLNHF